MSSFDRTPPQNIEAERSTLGAMLLNPEACGDATAILGRDTAVFYSPAHSHVYAAIHALQDASKPVDEITVIDALQAAGKLDAAGGLQGISEIAESVQTSAHAAEHAAIVRGAWECREMIRVGEYLVARGYAHDNDARETVSEAESMIAALAQSRTTVDVRHIADGFETVLDAIEKQHQSGTVPGVMTGLERIDNLTWGFQPGELIVVAARPSVGKTAFALHAAAHCAEHHGPVLFFSLEMTKEMLQTRIMAALGKVPASDQRTGYLGGLTRQKLLNGASKMQGLDLWVAEAMRVTPLDIRSLSRKVQQRRGLAMICIDYLQLLQSGKRFERRQLEIGYITRTLKAIALELKVPVMLLCQLNREAVGVDDGFKLKDQLREAGDIEQDADQLITLAGFAEDTKQRWVAENSAIVPAANHKWHLERLLVATVAKHRNGPTGGVQVLFRKDTQEFEEWASVRARMDEGKLAAAADDEAF